jgi:hypothetical protein
LETQTNPYGEYLALSSSFFGLGGPLLCLSKDNVLFVEERKDERGYIYIRKRNGLRGA